MTEKFLAAFKTARELHEFECSISLPLSSGCEALDNIMGGGFFPGCVTEISGGAGCGKSQICMQFAATTIANGKNVICIETERGFSVSRVRQMLEFRSDQADQALQRLLISSPSTLEQLMNVLSRLSLSSWTQLRHSFVAAAQKKTFGNGEMCSQYYPILLYVTILL